MWTKTANRFNFNANSATSLVPRVLRMMAYWRMSSNRTEAAEWKITETSFSNSRLSGVKPIPKVSTSPRTGTSLSKTLGFSSRSGLKSCRMEEKFNFQLPTWWLVWLIARRIICKEEIYHGKSAILTGTLFISSSLVSTFFECFSRSSTKTRFTSGHERRSFSISTLPTNPVAPVMNISRFR